MSDIVERLQENVDTVPDAYWHSIYIKSDVQEAINEIERLRKIEKAVRKAMPHIKGELYDGPSVTDLMVALNK